MYEKKLWALVFQALGYIPKILLFVFIDAFANLALVDLEENRRW